MYSSARLIAHRLIAACALLAALAAAGCHGNNSTTSGYGVAWVTVGTVPAPVFTSYVVNVNSIVLTDTVGNAYTALATVEPVDFTKLSSIRELWGSATIPNDTYKSATIVLDYTNAAISVLAGGVPQKATVVGAGGAAVTTVSVTVNFDPANQLVIAPSFSTDNAQLLALNFDLPASNRVDFSTSPATVTVSPFMTVSLAPPDAELIRVRGPLINSSTTQGTYTVYERPFYDQVNSIASLSIFNDQNTVYTIDGTSYVGGAGLNALSQTPAGVTITAAYTKFQPTATATAFAGRFNSVYVVAGNSLQSTLTENISGDVIARSGNTLTLRGATVYGQLVSLSAGYFGYQNADTNVLVGPNTVVTLDDDASVKGLDYNSIAVGQHIEAVGTYTVPGSGVVTIDATSAATGKVRLQSTESFGQLISAVPGSLTLSLQSINGWPANIFNFTGNGASPASDSSAANYVVSTPSLDLSGTAAGTPRWIDGRTARFGAAPPDFVASTVGQESATPATISAVWNSTGSAAPFSVLAVSGLQINLSDPNLISAVLQIGPESAALSSLPASPQITPTAAPVSIAAAPVFSPAFAFGGTTAGVNVYSSFPSFATNLAGAVSATAPVLQLVAGGLYNRATNTFTANTVSVVVL